MSSFEGSELTYVKHQSGLVAHYGKEPIVTWLGPLAVDGLIVMATGALLATDSHHTNQPSIVDTRPYRQ